MKKELRDNSLKSIPPHIREALLDYLQEKIDYCVDIAKYPPQSWEEVLGRQEAVKVLKDIFKFLNPKAPIGGTKEDYR